MFSVNKFENVFLKKPLHKELYRSFCAKTNSDSSKDNSKKINKLEILNKIYKGDDWTNIPNNVLENTGRNLHLNESHPIGIIRNLIESQFKKISTLSKSCEYKFFNNLQPVVSVTQNFDSLAFPIEHPGRSKTDTYYVNSSTVLRTHTSAHQVELIKKLCEEAESIDPKEKKIDAFKGHGFLASADVYRRDTIDKSHYPAFHQMEGVRIWDRSVFNSENELIDAINAETLQIQNLKISTGLGSALNLENSINATGYNSETNPRQSCHSELLCEAIGNHLKRTIELVITDIFTRARLALLEQKNEQQREKKSTLQGSELENFNDKNLTEKDLPPLNMRWIEGYFPFTSPSWETEVFYNNDWLELLGCGVINQTIIKNAGPKASSHVGWAFGMGLERLAMVLFSIPDIRLFWTHDSRFLSQFKDGKVKAFVPYSKYPSTYRDISFWLPAESESSSTNISFPKFHENELMEIIRSEAGDIVQNVTLVDEFIHPKTKKHSLCYRTVYQSMDCTLVNENINEIDDKIRKQLIKKFKVTLR